MKNKIQYIIIFVLIIALLLSVSQCEIKNRRLQASENSKDSSLNVIKKYENKNGDLVYQVKTYIATIYDLKNDKDLLGADKKRLEKIAGNLKNVAGYWKGKAEAKDSFAVKNTDTIYYENHFPVAATTFKWDNGHLKLSGISTHDSTRIIYDYRLSFQLTPYWKRYGFLGLGKKTLYSDIYFSDPNLSVREYKAIYIQKPPKTLIEKTWFDVLLASIAGFLFGVSR